MADRAYDEAQEVVPALKPSARSSITSPRPSRQSCRRRSRQSMSEAQVNQVAASGAANRSAERSRRSLGHGGNVTRCFSSSPTRPFGSAQEMSLGGC